MRVLSSLKEFTISGRGERKFQLNLSNQTSIRGKTQCSSMSKPFVFTQDLSDIATLTFTVADVGYSNGKTSARTNRCQTSLAAHSSCIQLSVPTASCHQAEESIDPTKSSAGTANSDPTERARRGILSIHFCFIPTIPPPFPVLDLKKTRGKPRRQRCVARP